MNETNASTPSQWPIMPETFLQGFVKKYFGKKQTFLKAVEQYGSPLYLIETSVLQERARQFRGAFEKTFAKASFYYAMKSNNLPDVSRILLDQGFGLDVSSGLELETALELNAGDIIFSGPGKTDPELQLAADHWERVTVLLDSPGECRRLKSILNNRPQTLKVGIRLNNNPEGLWRKFGILPRDLLALYQEIAGHPNLEFCGLQFHSSWNLVPDRQIEFIQTLGNLLKTMPPGFLSACEFLDIGGGYWPGAGEWLLSDDALQHYQVPAVPLREFAEKLGACIQEEILSLTDCRICFEPGRWICNDALHILIQVIDKKAPDLVIADAGTNAVGWERYETDYFPVLNLTQPGMTERACHILGSLCTPHDVWGYAYFGEKISQGDILMIPTQGAYTYSLRQQFIKPLPRVVILD